MDRPARARAIDGGVDGAAAPGRGQRRWRGRPRSWQTHPSDVARSVTMGGAFAFPAHGRLRSRSTTPSIQAAEIPAANGISTARSLARLYAGVRVGDRRAAAHPTRRPWPTRSRVRSAGPQLSGMPDDGARWGTGFQLASPPSQPMLGPASFGHAGAGGQLAFGDVEHEVGFAYLGNQMGGFGDARARELTDALASGAPGLGPEASLRDARPGRSAATAAADLPGLAGRQPARRSASCSTGRSTALFHGRPRPAAVPVVGRPRVRAADLRRDRPAVRQLGRHRAPRRAATTCCST